MADYAIYEYTISQAIDGNLNLTPEMVSDNLAKKQLVFASLFEGNKLNLYISKSDGEIDHYDNYKLKGIDNVFVYQINNIKKMNIVKDSGKTNNGVPLYESVSEISKPLARIIIDNRDPDKGLIAIEKEAGWGKTPDKLRGLLEVSFRRVLTEYGLDIKITAMKMPTVFWEFVDRQCKKYKDTVTKVTIDFLTHNKQKQKSAHPRQRASSALTSMFNLSAANNAIKSTFSMEFESVTARKIKDMVRIADLCDQAENYALSIYFSKFGLYRSNQLVTAFFPLEDEVLNLFGWQKSSTMIDTNSSFELMKWLDDVKKQIVDLHNEAKTPAKIKR